MRPIKFRAWDKDSEVMIPDIGVTPRGIAYAIPLHSEGFENFFYFENAILMQFTGLFDRHGKEIWEGDIVKIVYYEADEDMKEEASIHRVVWMASKNYPAFDIEPIESCIDCESNGLSWAIAEHSIEVIGNIYENGDLLK